MSLLGLVVIAAWALVLTVAFNLVLGKRLDRERDTLLRTRAAAAAATLDVAGGSVKVRERSGDAPLDTGMWIYSGPTSVERPSAPAALQRAADALAGLGPSYRSAPDGYRLFALPVLRADRAIGTVVASISTAPYDHAARATLEGSAVLVALLLPGAYVVLRLVAARALRPMDEMTRRAADWSAHSLTERFGADQRFQEMQSLAGTLDGVLDRLAAVVRHERGLSSELSHELRTPLSSIMAETDLLLARAHSAAENETAYRGIRESAVAMNDILQTLLASARFEMQQAPGRCALRPVVDAAVRAHRTTARRSAPPTIHVDVADSIDVGVDGAVVERILAPLLDNARRYATDEVWIGAHRASDSVVVEIRDDGPGVPAGMAELIFEPGQRASYHDRHDGAGLGLALARRLARTAGGDITCTGGSTFRVRFPPA